MRTSAKRLAARLALAAASVAFTLVALELALRLLTGDRYIFMYPRLKNGTLTYLPSQEGRFKHMEWDIRIRINSRGFRDDEPEAAAAKPRIVALGDSFTEGYGVDLERSWPKVLEHRLASSGIDAEVRNAGHSNTQPRQYIRTYRDHFRSEPGVVGVVMGFFVENDLVSPNHPDLLLEDPEAYRRSIGYLFQEVRTRIAESSALYCLVAERMKRSSGLSRVLPLLNVYTGPPIELLPIYRKDGRPETFDYTLRTIDDFRHELEREGRRFLAVLLPRREQVDDDYWKRILASRGLAPTAIDRDGAFAYITDWAKKKGFATLDLVPALRAAQARQKLYFELDPHFNPAGHAVCAAEVEKAVRPWFAAGRR